MKGCRDKAMLEVLYATGIRVSELIGLNIDDVSLPGSFIRCESGEKTRIIPIYPEALQSLHEYIDSVRPKMIAVPTEHSLFVNVSGERMSRQGFWKIIKYYQEKAQYRQGYHPAYASPQLCGPPAGKRRRPALHSADARPQRYFLHPGLYAAGEAESEGGVQQISPEGLV